MFLPFLLSDRPVPRSGRFSEIGVSSQALIVEKPLYERRGVSEKGGKAVFYFVLIAIDFGLTISAFGSVTVRIPFR